MRQIVIVAVFFTTTACWAEPANDQASFQGVWFGTGTAQRIVLVVRDDKMVFIHPMGAKESSFRVNKDAGFQEIDIDCYDGKMQLGIYHLDELKLIMTLADPDKSKRPTSVGITNSGNARKGTTIFTRNITPEGLQTLQVNLSRNRDIDLTTAKAPSDD